MARALKMKCLMIIWSALWISAACNGASATSTLKPGETLDSHSSLVSGKFTMIFRVYDHEVNLSYLVIKYNASPNFAWVGNRETPTLYPFGVLQLDRNNTLKISQRNGDDVVLYSAAHSDNISGDVVATLKDDGNFVLQELSSDGSEKRVLWQSFNYPGDVLLPGMKLGVNHGQNWSLSCWLSGQSAVPGPFTLDWDPAGKELKIKRRGVMYWSSGVFRDGSFKNIKFKRYNFTIVEDYFSYNAVNENAISEWMLTTTGRLRDFDGSVHSVDGSVLDIGKADECYGYNTDGGCQIWDQPSQCVCFGHVFEMGNGYFNPADSRGSPTTSTTDSNTSLSISDCKAACWAGCNCRGFIILYANRTGCRYWIGSMEFIADGTSYSSKIVYFLMTKSADSSSHQRIWIGAAIGTSVILTVVCILCYLLRRRKLSLFEDRVTRRESDQDLPVYRFSAIKTATDDFADSNKLGEGGYGPVYKGKLLQEGQEIAVKRLSKISRQGLEEFKNEVSLIRKLQHRNLGRLLGCCTEEEESILIYEFMPNNSLDSFIFDSSKRVLLDWARRMNIIEGIAHGLLYLHKYSRLRIIHRDLKTSNILLDCDMNPKISDFGMARIVGDCDKRGQTNRVVGTIGYMSPEYAMESRADPAQGLLELEPRFATAWMDSSLKNQTFSALGDHLRGHKRKEEQCLFWC